MRLEFDADDSLKDTLMMGYETEEIQLQKGGEMTIDYGRRSLIHMVFKAMGWYMMEVIYQGRGQK